MKKVISFVLLLIICVTATGCGSSYDATLSEKKSEKVLFTETIPIADDIEPIDITADCFGEYEKVDSPKESLIYEGESGFVYYDKDANVPYIYVQTIPKKGVGFEAFVKEQAKDYGNGTYQMIDEKTCYYTCSTEDQGAFYYESVYAYDSEDKIYQVMFEVKTEEITLTDKLKMYIPVGYSKPGTKRDSQILHINYDENYYIPNILITLDKQSFESTELDYEGQGALNFTEEDFNTWSKNWNEESYGELFNSVGYEVTSYEYVDNKKFTVESYTLKNLRHNNSIESIVFVNYAGNRFRINAYTDLTNPNPEIIDAVVNAIHIGE